MLDIWEIIRASSFYIRSLKTDDRVFHYFLVTLMANWYWTFTGYLFHIMGHTNCRLMTRTQFSEIFRRKLPSILECFINRVTRYIILFAGNIYRRGARRWRKLYKVNGHTFSAKRFSRVGTFRQTFLPFAFVLFLTIFS